MRLNQFLLVLTKKECNYHEALKEFFLGEGGGDDEVVIYITNLKKNDVFPANFNDQLSDRKNTSDVKGINTFYLFYGSVVSGIISTV